MFSARAPHAETPTKYPAEQKVVPCTCLSSGDAPRGQARSGAPGNLSGRLAVSPTIASESFSSPFSIASPSSSIPLIGLSALPCVLIRLQSPRRFPGPRLHLLSSFFLGALTFLTRRAARIVLALSCVFHVCELLVLRDVKKKKKPPIQWLGLVRLTDTRRIRPSDCSSFPRA